MSPISMLQQLVAINSISSVNPTLDQANLPVIELLATWLEDLGFSIEIMPLDKPGKANLIATLGSGSGGLVLAGHTDTVPCDESLWESDPFRLTERHNRLYGLGTCDMKGFFPLAIEAAKSFVDQPLQQPLILLATADEESSMTGAKALSAAGKPLALYALIGEPSDMKPIHLHKGIMLQQLALTGQSGHSSNPALGRNALETMHAAMGLLLDWRTELQKKYRQHQFEIAVPTLNLGCISGGNNPNRICGECQLGFELRLLPGMDSAELQTEIGERLHALAKRDGIGIQLDQVSVPAFAARDNSALLPLCENITGQPRISVSFATEAPFLQQLGMDVVVMGPGNVAQAHQPNEYLEMDIIEPAIDSYHQIIEHCCLRLLPDR